MSDPASQDRILRLNAALDGELDAASSLELEREMQENPALAAEYRRLEALRGSMARLLQRETAPKALADRIAALGAPAADSVSDSAPSASVVPLARPPVGRPNWSSARVFALAASVAAAGFAVGAGVTALRMQSAAPGVAAGLVSDFARASIAGQPYDVASSDRHTVKPWLAGRTTVSAAIVDLAPQGFPLAGGRVAIVDRIPAPTLVYRHNEHLAAVTELPPGGRGAGAGAPAETIDGYHVARWSDANLNYLAVSDMDEGTLAEFVAAFRQAQKPAAEAPAK
jgi:anti-sigma factor RsiW